VGGVTDAVSVALPLPVQTPFTYRVPEGLLVPVRGARVVVPFGPRRVVGVAMGRPRPRPGRAEGP
jgi:primosomal protein N'